VPPRADADERDAFWPAAQRQLRAWELELRELEQGPAALALTSSWAELQQVQGRERQALRELHAQRRALRHAARRALRATSAGGVGGDGEHMDRERAAALHALDQQSRGDAAERRRQDADHAQARQPIAEAIAAWERARAELATTRARTSAAVQRRLHELVRLRSFAGVTRSLPELFAPHEPPSGAGDCAGPKLVGYAIAHQLRPLALAELWWGPSPAGGGRHHGQYYPACRGKCGPILPHMLTGIAVAEAPSFGAVPPTAATSATSATSQMAATSATGQKAATGATSATGQMAATSATGQKAATGHMAATGQIAATALRARGGQAQAGAATAAALPPSSHAARAPGAADLGLDVVFEDDWLIIVDKPCGLLSVPGREPGLRDSVLTRLRAAYPQAHGALLVHRLDLDTSGLLVAAKDPATHAALQRQFASRQIDKRYLAWLDGTVRGEAGSIELALRLDPDDRPRQVYDPVHGKPALTQWRVLERTSSPAGPRTRVALSPRTGRTHQLRVHAAHPLGLGAPICGDRLYGRPGPRLLLHAEALTFTHPSTQQRVEFVRAAPFYPQSHGS
jgi:RluA family pseudouridine synthase